MSRKITQAVLVGSIYKSHCLSILLGPMAHGYADLLAETTHPILQCPYFVELSYCMHLGPLALEYHDIIYGVYVSLGFCSNQESETKLT